MQASQSSSMVNYASVLLNAIIQPSTHTRTYHAGLYLRLSRDDNNGNAESMSIQSQRDMLVSYANEHGYEVMDIYIDDGFTGTNFDRPSFQRMINDIKLGRINMVITKDAYVKHATTN